MIVLDGPHEGWRVPGPTGVAVGVFDGVHLGHRHVLSLLVERCAAAGLLPTVLTFDPHPLQVLAPDREPARLTTLPQRIELLESVGIGAVAVLGFTESVRDMAAEDFIADLLVERLDARLVAAGNDFRFGAGRRGDMVLLEQMADRYEVLATRLVGEGGGISSTRIRRAVAGGDVETAASLLGRAYTVDGSLVGEDRVDGVVVTTLEVPVPGAALPHGGHFAGAVGDAAVGLRVSEDRMTVVSAEPLSGTCVAFLRQIAGSPTGVAELLEAAHSSAA